MSENKAKSKPIIKELDCTIETAIPKSQQLSFAKEITFKLIPAMAIASFAVYLIIFDRHFNNLSLNPVYSFVYILGLFLYGVYLINANRLYKTVLKQIYVICIFSGGMYLILTTKEYWSLPMDIYSSYLYMFSLFAVVLADTFYLIDYAYSTPRYAGGKLFENKDFQNSSTQQDLVTKLDEFSQAEIDEAYSEIETMTETLFNKINTNIESNSALFTILFCGLILINLFQIFPELNWLTNPFILGYAILLILLSAIEILLVVKNINNLRQSDRYDRYLAIVTEYQIERIGITEFFKRRKSKIITEIEEQML